MDKIKKDSAEAKANVARRIAKAKVRVRHQDYDASNSPGTLSLTAKYLRKKAREAEKRKAGKEAFDGTMKKASKKKSKKAKKGVRSLASPSDPRDDKHITGQMMRDHRAARERMKAKEDS